MIVFSPIVSNRNIAHRPTKSASADLPCGVNARGLTRKQAAAMFGFSLSGFDKARREGKIPPPTLPGKRYDLVLLQAKMNALSGISGGSEALSPLEQWRASRAH
jgi:hypothetical protein